TAEAEAVVSPGLEGARVGHLDGLGQAAHGRRGGAAGGGPTRRGEVGEGGSGRETHGGGGNEHQDGGRTRPPAGRPPGSEGTRPARGSLSGSARIRTGSR